jgi:hypothetical protein
LLWLKAVRRLKGAGAAARLWEAAVDNRGDNEVSADRRCRRVLLRGAQMDELTWVHCLAKKVFG